MAWVMGAEKVDNEIVYTITSESDPARELMSDAKCVELKVNGNSRVDEI